MNEAIYLPIHTDSLGSVIGAIITAAFSIYYLTFYLTIRRERFYRSLSVFFFTVSVYLSGFAVYSSSGNPLIVLAWTRVCYAGVSAAIFTSYTLSSNVTSSRNSFLTILFLSISTLLVIATVIPGELFFTGTLNPEKYHSSVIKGEFFPYLLYVIYVSMGFLLIRFVTKVIQDKSRLKYYLPIIVGLAFWFFEGIFDGVFGALLSLVSFKLSLGPLVMTFALAIFAGKISEAQRLELVRMKRENEEIYRNLIYDKLSGLFTRTYFIETLAQKIAVHSRKDKNDTVVFIDVDNFKSINDELGHEKGDAVIKLVGTVLKSHSRKTDICARFGGDEFLMLLEDCSGENAVTIAGRIQDDFAKQLYTCISDWPRIGQVSLSIGVLPSDYWPQDPQEILKKADRTMYESKHLGKDRISLFEADDVRSM